MRLVTALFRDPAGVYSRLCDALVDSVAANSPRTPLTIVEIPGPADEPPPLAPVPRLRPPAYGTPAYRRLYVPHVSKPIHRRRDPKRQTLAWNVAKLAAWNDAVQAGRDGEVIALLDCDTLVRRDLSGARALPFDVAYTVREDGRLPFNGGVVLVRVGPASRECFARWRERDAALFADPRRHHPFRIRYAGMNQASWGSLLEDGIAADYQVAQLPCRIWNAQDSSWRFVTDETRIVHVKGALRKACLGASPYYDPALSSLVALWRRYDRVTRVQAEAIA